MILTYYTRSIPENGGRDLASRVILANISLASVVRCGASSKNQRWIEESRPFIVINMPYQSFGRGQSIWNAKRLSLTQETYYVPLIL